MKLDFFAKKQVSQIQDYKDTFTSDSGERVLLDLMERCDMLNSTRNLDDPNTDNMIFREGQRNVVLRILTLVEKDMKQLRILIKQREEQIRQEGDLYDN